jgi:hypothetical protein
LEIVTVALDTGGVEAARPWIEAARPGHPSLVDAAHVVDERLGVVNVPNAVWIDENGMIVRPAEPAWPGRTPVLDMVSELNDEDLPPERAAVRTEMSKMRIDPEQYLNMVRDWVDHGAQSRYVLEPSEVIARSQPRSVNAARAAAAFELGQHLHRGGDHDAAIIQWREAHRLDPLNWTYKRQAWQLESVDSVTPSGVYEGSWLADVQELGAENYYPAIEP